MIVTTNYDFFFFFNLFKTVLLPYIIVCKNWVHPHLLLVIVTVTYFSYCITLQSIFLVLNQIIKLYESKFLNVGVGNCMVLYKCISLPWKKIVNQFDHLSKMKPLFEISKRKRNFPKVTCRNSFSSAHLLGGKFHCLFLTISN